MDKVISDILPRLVEACPYLGAFIVGAIFGRWLKSPATEKEWKALISERIKYAKNLEQDIKMKEKRLDVFHEEKIAWQEAERDLKNEIGKLRYNNKNQKIPATAVTVGG
ncbi:MAG: hypothetical protein L3J71_03610 [Victivallaceae bacterium]|nr:hypothetical protein [Victivallaceae bacterium]